MTRGCLAGSGVCFISHRGDVQPCGYLSLAAGNVLRDGIKKIWQDSELFLTLRDAGKLGGKCRARAYYATGGYAEEEPYCMYAPGEQG